MRRLLAVAALAVALVGASASAASAHAVLTTSSPVDGETVDASPGEIVLNFNERVTVPPNAIRVFDTDGARVDDAAPAQVGPDGMSLAAPLPQLADGSYVIAWRATSADGHPIRGALTFAVGAPGPVDRAGLLGLIPEEDEAVWQVTAVVTRWLMYGGALLAVGGVVFLLRVHDRREEELGPLMRIVAVAAVVAAAATVAGVLWQGVLVSGLGAAALVNPGVVGSVLTSGFGASAIVRVIGLGTLVGGARRLWQRTPVLVAAAGAALTLASFVLTGHTAATTPRAVATVANLAHTTAGATWFGGLVLLLVTLRRRASGDGTTAMVDRWKRLAILAVISVSVAGLGLAWIEVRALRALTSTQYGWTLLAKVAIVALVLAGGAYNHRRTLPSRTVVRLEIAGIVAVLAVTGLLVTLVPARTAAGIGGFYQTTTAMGDYRLDMTVDPNHAGQNELHLYLLSANGQPTEIAGAGDLEVLFSLPAMDIGPIERTATVAGPGHWTMSGTEMSIGGQWQLEFVLPTSRFEELRTKVTVPVNG